jgi:hypothetical protein
VQGVPCHEFHAAVDREEVRRVKTFTVATTAWIEGTGSDLKDIKEAEAELDSMP